MACEYLRFRGIYHMMLLLVMGLLVLDSSHVLVRGKVLEPKESNNNSASPKGTVKTMKGENGDVVDCVHIHKQPAFDHPLVKNHKIQMDPSASVRKMNQSNPASNFIRPWNHKNICAEGTVPIRRRLLQDKHPKSKTHSNDTTKGPHFEYAMVQAYPATGTRFYGGSATLSIWDPAVSRQHDFSESTLVVQLSPLVFLEAGWIVFPERYHDSRPRLYSYFTIDNSTASRCWDLDCNNGFVQVNNAYTLGTFLSQVSIIGDQNDYWIDVTIYQDRKTRNWWLNFQNISIGYWPASLFADLPEGAELLAWGGTIYDSVGDGSHTETDMGNGLLPDVGTADKASQVCSLYYVDDAFTLQIPDQSNLRVAVSNPLCYNAQIFPVLDPRLGQCFSFGGPGRNPNCL